MKAEHDAYAAIEEQAETWLVRLRSGQATPADAQAFRDWCARSPEHARAAQELGKVWRTLNLAAAANARQESASARAPASASTSTAVPVSVSASASGRDTDRSGWAPARIMRPGRRAFVGGAVAATAAWLALRPPLQLWPAVTDFSADYRTGTGEQRQLALSDHAVIEMNTQTRINVRTAAAMQDGIDLLAGEAEIAAGAGFAPAFNRTAPADPAFTVVAGNGQLQTRGARFNVRFTGPSVCVTCLAGSVELTHLRQRVTLAASQQLTYTSEDIQPATRVDLAAVTSWRRGVLVFNDTPLSQVVEEINRYRPGKLILRNTRLGESRVQAQFSIHQLDDAIVLVRDLYGAHVTELPGGIALLT